MPLVQTMFSHVKSPTYHTVVCTVTIENNASTAVTAVYFVGSNKNKLEIFAINI